MYWRHLSVVDFIYNHRMFFNAAFLHILFSRFTKMCYDVCVCVYVFFLSNLCSFARFMIQWKFVAVSGRTHSTLRSIWIRLYIQKRRNILDMYLFFYIFLHFRFILHYFLFYLEFFFISFRFDFCFSFLSSFLLRCVRVIFGPMIFKVNQEGR